MSESRKPVGILLADDDADDREMARKALERNCLPSEFNTVQNGRELLDYLNHRGKYAPPAKSPLPGLILLDSNLSKMDGREALAAIKADPVLRRIPVVVMTNTKAEEEIFRSHNPVFTSFVSKPISFSSLTDVTIVLGKYWFQMVTIPLVAQKD